MAQFGPALLVNLMVFHLGQSKCPIWAFCTAVVSLCALIISPSIHLEHPLSNTHSVIPAAGIDVGFYSTNFTYGKATTQTGTEILVDQFLSVAPVVNGPIQHLPGTSRHDGVQVTVDGQTFFVGKSAPDMVNGRGGLREAVANYSQTPEYKALFLGALYQIAKHRNATGSLTIKHLTVGLPLSTVLVYSKSLKDYSQGEHTIPSPANPNETIRVHIQNVIVVSQPQGALIGHYHQLGELSKHVKNSRVLVLDMGGGTFDWFVADSMRPQIERCGDAPLGMLACASAVCDLINPTLRSNPDVMADIDRAMREDLETVFVSGEERPMANLWPAAEGIVRSAIVQMQKKVGKLDGMRHILLTGGGAPLVKKFAAGTILGQFDKVISIDIDPINANVRGFHCIAEMHANSDE